MDEKELAGHLSAAGAYVIFGLNIVMCKDIFNSGTITPAAMFFVRALVATVCFWVSGIFLPREKVYLKDLLKIALASLVGIFIPQFTFLFAVKVTTAIDTSIITTLTPIFTMFVAAIFLKEPITLKKAGGVAISFAGVIFLILNTVISKNGVDSTSPVGVVLLLLNGLSFALYLGAFKPLISKYSVTTFMKWMFFFSLLYCLPLSFTEFVSTDFSAISFRVVAEIAFVAVFATYIAYILVPLGQKRIRPTLISMYSYLQPIIAAFIAIASGLDTLTWQKFLAASLIVSGVVLVKNSRSAASSSLGS